jgi:hypothetical protein
MKQHPILIPILAALAALVALAGCAGALGPRTTPTALPTFTPPALPPTVAATETPTPTVTPVYPAEGYGPTNFPTDVNPLTGLKVSNPALLERRPMAVKVANLPRSYRPQWGLSLADIVYEYYTEEGTTRFVALFLGNDAQTVGPIRSARFFDGNIVRMYKSILAFGSAYIVERQRLYNSDFASRLVVETSCPPMCRYEPNGVNYLMTNTADLSAYITQAGVENGRQNLDGMLFKQEAPQGGQPASQAFLHYSAAIRNRWDYDPATGKYSRFSETTDNTGGPENDVYAPLTDRLTNAPITADNVLVALMPHEYYSQKPEIIDFPYESSGPAYLFRDGQVYKALWQRPTADSVLSLSLEDGTPLPFKPGNTWVEVIGSTSTVAQEGEDAWRFTFSIP